MVIPEDPRGAPPIKFLTKHTNFPRYTPFYHAESTDTNRLDLYILLYMTAVVD